MKKSVPLRAAYLAFFSVYSSMNNAAPVQLYAVPYVITDVATSAVSLEMDSNAGSGSVSDMATGTLTSSIDAGYINEQVGVATVNGTQSTSITADPSGGSVVGQSSSIYTVSTTASGSFVGLAESTVTGKFIVPVPPVVTGLTDILFDISISGSGANGAVMSIVYEGTILGAGNAAAIASQVFSDSFVPGDEVTFTAEITTVGNIGFGGPFDGFMVDRQIAASLNIYSLVPIPPGLWLFASGLLGLIGISRRNRAA